jgi:hypothetical protein
MVKVNQPVDYAATMRNKNILRHFPNRQETFVNMLHISGF